MILVDQTSLQNILSPTSDFICGVTMFIIISKEKKKSCKKKKQQTKTQQQKKPVLFQAFQ